MPYKSDAQRKFFHANEGKKGIAAAMVDEYDKASKGKKLPERLKPVKVLSFDLVKKMRKK